MRQGCRDVRDVRDVRDARVYRTGDVENEDCSLADRLTMAI